MSRRALSLHERYSVCRRNCGFPIPNTVLLSYTTDDRPAPTANHLLDRIHILLQHYPLLGSEIRDSLTRSPHFATRVEPLTPVQILTEEKLQADITRDEVLLRAIHQAESAPADGPLWLVTIYTTASASYLAVSAQHELLDGIGLLRLVMALTADDISALPCESFQTVIGMSSPDYKPSLSFLLPLVYSEMVLPALPKWLQVYVRPTPCWPVEIDLHPSKAPWSAASLSIDTDKLSAVGATGKVHGVKTLHPIIKVAYLAAIRSVFGSDSPGVKFAGTTPRNERDPKLGHPYMTGNYTSSLDWTLPASSSFWSACQACYNDFQSPQAISIGRQRMGLLAYLPDKESTAPSSDPRRATGWETSYTEKFDNGVNTYSLALSLSNFGRAKLPTNATDMVWGFPGSPFAPPLSLAIIGHEGGLRIYQTWREGCPVTREHVSEIQRRFVEIIDRAVKEDFPLN